MEESSALRSNWIIFNHASFEIHRARVKDMKEMGRGRRSLSRKGQGERERERPEKFLGWKTSTRTLIEQFKAMPSNSVRTFFVKLLSFVSIRSM